MLVNNQPNVAVVAKIHKLLKMSCFYSASLEKNIIRVFFVSEEVLRSFTTDMFKIAKN